MVSLKWQAPTNNEDSARLLKKPAHYKTRSSYALRNLHQPISLFEVTQSTLPNDVAVGQKIGRCWQILLFSFPLVFYLLCHSSAFFLYISHFTDDNDNYLYLFLMIIHLPAARQRGYDDTFWRETRALLAHSSALTLLQWKSC